MHCLIIVLSVRLVIFTDFILGDWKYNDIFDADYTAHCNRAATEKNRVEATSVKLVAIISQFDKHGLDIYN